MKSLSTSLTTQELRVAEAFAEGRTTKEVAEHLCKSTSTVTGQIQSIYEKKNLPHNINALSIWYLCKKYGLELPELLRRAGATLLLLIFFSTICGENEMRRTRRVRRTTTGQRKQTI